MAGKVKVRCFIARSKKTKRYFKFTEYCSDGWGEYSDDIKEITPTELPTLFEERDGKRNAYLSAFKGHSSADVEFIRFSLIEE